MHGTYQNLMRKMTLAVDPHQTALITRDHLLQAHPRRMAKVSKQIEREIGSLFLSDEVRSGSLKAKPNCAQECNIPELSAQSTDVLTYSFESIGAPLDGQS